MAAEFTKEMKKTHTILLPMMLPYHNRLLQAAFSACGYRLEIMPEAERLSERALPYISGDYCLPALLILGQMLSVVEDGKYDCSKIALMEPQTGGACRAGNYYNLMIESLKKAGFLQVPVISLNAFGEEKQAGFRITPKLVKGAVAAVCYGDLLMSLYQQLRSYEKEAGSADRKLQQWTKLLAEEIENGKYISRKFRKERYRKIINDFNLIERNDISCRRIGIAGEIYMKFSPVGNDNLEEFLQKLGCEYRMGGFVNYAIYLVDTERDKQRLLGAGSAVLAAIDEVKKYLLKIQMEINEAFKETSELVPDSDFEHLKELAQGIIDSQCNIGDGWLIAGEAADLIEKGFTNILILHPFGCLVSHVCGRGILKNLHEKYPNVNIQTIEYDYDSSKTLRESRIMLGISNVLRVK